MQIIDCVSTHSHATRAVMAPARLLERNVRPVSVRGYEEEGNLSEEDANADEDSDENEDLEDIDDASLEDGDEKHVRGGDGTQGESDGEDAQEGIENVSFRALLHADTALSRKRKRGSDVTAEQDEKLQTIRARLAELKSDAQRRKLDQPRGERRPEAARDPADAKPRIPTGAASYVNSSAAPVSQDEEGDESDSAPSEEDIPSKARTSKHAPTAQSSKHQVTRKRNVVDVPKRVTRDPRFDALHQNSAHPGSSDKAYGFIRDYQKNEIAELKSALKQTRNEDDKETLKRKIVSMENRIKTKEGKDREQEVLRRHRKEEKEKVEQGKKPFFLKRKDLKEQALVEKFKGMKGKEREKLMEKRRLKESQREKKRMPDARRMAG